MFRYVLFDLDGTLTDPKIGITSSVQYALKYYGIMEENLNNLTPFIGPPLKDSFMEFYGFSDEKAKEAIEKYRERFSTIGLYENEIYPGVVKMLQKLKKAGVRLAVASSKPTIFVEKILKYFKIDSYFDVVVGSELDGRRTDKEEVIIEALKNLGVTESNKAECAMVGDRKFDIIGAKKRQVFSVGVAYGYAKEGELEKENPDYIATDVEDLTRFLLGNNKKYDFGCMSKIFQIISPILTYYIVSNLVVFLTAFFIGYFSKGDAPLLAGDYLSKYSHAISVGIRMISILFATGLLIPSLYDEGVILFKNNKTKKKSILLVFLVGCFAALFLNVLFGLLHITDSSKIYNQVADNQFSLPLVWGILLYGIVTPITEEIVFRGLVYNRLRKSFSFLISLVASAILFGVYHGNIVQACYGFLLGLLIAWIYEKYRSLVMPVLVHSAANITIYTVMGFQNAKAVIMKPVFCMAMGVMTVICMWFLCKKKAD